MTTLFVTLSLLAAGPLPAAESLRTIRVPEGFRVELVAAEPMVMDPVALAFDESGRMYVAEMGDYPLGPPNGRIKLLEDLDGDGDADRATLFADGVPYPTGVMPWRGGVLVTAAPDILFLRDTDGDGRADVRQVVFTGFGQGNQQHRVNTLQLAVDGWIYGSNGGSDGEIRRPDRPGGPAVSVRGADFRFRPDYSGFERSTGPGQYANTFDDWGNRFINNNTQHILHPALPLRYVARNPSLSASGLVESIPDHSSQVFPTSELAERPNSPGQAGHFTSACSVTIYRAALFPPAYRGNAFVCEPVHNLVHRDLIVPSGSTYKARRGDDGVEFLTSTDGWFRPVSLTVGPEGALYVVDMYRQVIEHPEWIPLEMQKRVDLRAGHDRGRIYRVVPSAGMAAPRPWLDRAAPTALVAALEHPNGWWRLTAQRLLIERHDRRAVPALERMLRTSKSAPGRLHTLYVLESFAALRSDQIRRVMGDPEPEVRVHAVRLAEPMLAGSSVLLDEVVARAADPSPRVRLQAALSLGGSTSERAREALAQILLHDGGATDRWTRLAVLTGLSTGATEVLERMRARRPEYFDQPAPGALALVRDLGDLVGASRRDAEVSSWLRAISGHADTPPTRWRLTGLAALGPQLRRWGAAADAGDAQARARTRLQAWVGPLREMATAPDTDLADRVNAVDMLAWLGPEDVSARLEPMLDPRQPQEVQVAVARALAWKGGAAAASRLLTGWARYTAGVRRELLGALTADPALIPRVVEHLEKGSMLVSDLEAQHRERLLRHPDPSVRARAQKVLAARTSGEIAKVIDTLAPKILALAGNPVEGEKTYFSSCALCHSLHAQGHSVGPNLESVAGRDSLALLTDILDPSRAIAPVYRVYVVTTATQELSGIISAESPSSLTLRQAMSVETTIRRKDIREIRAWPASLMPEGLEKTLSPQGLADLLAFLGARTGALSR